MRWRGWFDVGEHQRRGVGLRGIFVVNSVPGTVSMRFAHDATVKVWTGRAFRRAELQIMGTVPIFPVEVSSADLQLAIHVERRGSAPESDRVMRYGNNLYRRVVLRGADVSATALHRELTSTEMRALEMAVWNAPAPASSLLPRYELRSPNAMLELDRAAQRGGRKLAAVETSNHDERWREASVHHQDSVLVCGDELYVRCREPAWQLTSPWRVSYVPARGAWLSHDHFGLDRFDDLRSYWKRSTRADWKQVEMDGEVRHLDHSFDDAAWLTDLGRQAMSYVPELRKVTRRADRLEAGCEPLLERMELLHGRDGPFTTSDARDAIEGVRDLGAALFRVIRIRRVAEEISANLWRSKLRLDQLDDRLNDLSEDDMEAIRSA